MRASSKLVRGDYQGSVVDTQQVLQIDRSSLTVGNLCLAYQALNRFDAAKTVLDQGLANGIDPSALASFYYPLAFLRNDRDGMEKQLALVAGKAGYEDALLSTQADTEAYYGRLIQAREYSRRASESARLSGTAEGAAGWVVNAALREAEFGNTAEARRDADSALRLSQSGRHTRSLAALARRGQGMRLKRRRLRTH
jgi:eukaryotic-like serine/threonine-protein kinase